MAQKTITCDLCSAVVWEDDAVQTINEDGEEVYICKDCAKEDEHAYLTSIGVFPEDMQSCLEAMAKYGDNHWWLSGDPKERAYYQVNEELLLMPESQFHADMDILLNRRVLNSEYMIANSIFRLQQEAERAWRWGVGATSAKERLGKIEQAMDDLGSIIGSAMTEVHKSSPLRYLDEHNLACKELLEEDCL